jgi:hypothetical protein
MWHEFENVTYAKIQDHKNNMQKILGAIVKIFGTVVTWHSVLVQA